MPKKQSQQRQGFAIAILAAGKGTRLKSRRPKVLHEIAGKPLLAHVVAAASKVVPPQNIFAIIGHEAERVREALAATGINFVLQREQRGTGHAMMEARDALTNFETCAGALGRCAADPAGDHRAGPRFSQRTRCRHDHAHCRAHLIPRDTAEFSASRSRARRATKSSASSSRNHCAATKPSSARSTPASTRSRPSRSSRTSASSRPTMPSTSTT